jgi:glycerol-3-phosphate cytidylyltransferase-like family protein
VGVHNDATVESYKRTPILSMSERIKVIESCKYIDKVIPDAPLNITQSYVDYHKIDIIYIPTNRTTEEIQLMVPGPYAAGMVKKIPYTDTISTSIIIERIKAFCST